MSEEWADTPLLERPEHPLWEWGERNLNDLIGEVRWWPVQSMLTSAKAAVRSRDPWMLKSAGVRTGIAIELYRRAHGEYPSDLVQLVPDFLDEVPIDMYSGEALRFALRDGVPVVYSVGCDMDDDEARSPSMSYGRFALSAAAWGPPRTSDPEWWTEERIREHDGDWILWPQIDPDTGEFIFTPR